MYECLWFNKDLTLEIKNDVSVVEIVSVIEDEPTFAEVPSTSSVPLASGQISSGEDILNDLSHKKGIKHKKKDNNLCYVCKYDSDSTTMFLTGFGASFAKIRFVACVTKVQ